MWGWTNDPKAAAELLLPGAPSRRASWARSSLSSWRNLLASLSEVRTLLGTKHGIPGMFSISGMGSVHSDAELGVAESAPQLFDGGGWTGTDCGGTGCGATAGGVGTGGDARTGSSRTRYTCWCACAKFAGPGPTCAEV